MERARPLQSITVTYRFKRGLLPRVPTVMIALGSNVGDRLSHLQKAVDLLKTAVAIEAASHVYETAPMYVLDQPSFYNAAVLAKTELAPLELLVELKSIESEIGRRNREANGPREVDLDLIVYGDLCENWQVDGRMRLQVPHPRLAERRFVLAPLADIAPEFSIPAFGQVRDLLEKTNLQAASVVRVKDAVLHL